MLIPKTIQEPESQILLIYCGKSPAAMIKVLIAPGPTITGKASGTIAIDSLSLAATSSSVVWLTGLSLDCNMESPINNKMIPPANRNEEMVMPNKSSNSLPIQSVINKILKMAIVEVAAIARCFCKELRLVKSKKIDNEPSGFIMITIATINFTKSACVMLSSIFYNGIDLS